MRFMKAVCLLLLISTFISIEAKENTKKKIKTPKKLAKASRKEEKIPDFSKGFAMFHQLGVPDVSKATYIKINDGSYYDSQKMSGNAWLVKDNGDDGIIVLKDNVQVKFHNPEKIRKQKAKELKELRKKFKGKDKGLAAANVRLGLKYRKIKSATYKKADLKKDIAAINKQISQFEKMRSGYNRAHFNDKLGKQFIFAINLHDKGYKRDANKIVSILFKNNGKKKTIVSVINQFANDLYTGIYKEFSRTKDWKKYSAQLDGLIKKMPAAWTKKPAMKLLELRIKERIAGKIPKLNAKGLSPKDLEIAKKLIDVKTFSRSNLWLLPPSEQENMYRTVPLKEDKALSEIFTNGVESIPLLVALLKDNYLTDLTMNYADHSYQRFSRQETRDNVNPEKAYKNIKIRPLSRGDIARALLSSILLEQERSFDEDEEDDTASRALELYKTLKGKKTEEIAEYYLKNGSLYGQKPAAVRYLSETKNSKYIAVVEKYFLDNASMRSNYEVTQYLDTRGPKAKKFVEKYLKALKGGLKNQLKEEARYAEGEKGLQDARKRLDRQYKEIEKNFKKYLSSETAEQFLMKIASQKKWDNSNNEALRFKCKKITFNKLVPLFLKATIAAKNTEVKSRLLRLVTMFQNPYARRAKDRKCFNDFKGTKSLWVKLVNDKAIMPHTTDYTMGEHAFSIIERISQKKIDFNKIRQLGMLPRVRSTAILEKRGLGRLDGKTEDELPLLPDASKVSDAEYKKLVSELLKYPSSQLIKKVRKISDNMFLKLVANLQKNPALNKKLLVTANKITKIDNKIKDKNVLKQLPQIKGELNEKIVRKIFESLKNIKLKKQYVSCKITANTGLDGVTVRFSLKKKRENKHSKVDYFCGTISGNGNYINCSWIVKTKKDDKKTKGSDEDDDLFAEAEEDVDDDVKDELVSKQKSFWEGVKRFQNRTNAMRRGTIYFTYN
jgi:hypothetical protein